MIKLITAFDKNKLIGCRDQLCWSVPSDLNHFKETTLNKTVLFGQVTFDGFGRTLPNRNIIVLSHDETLSYDYDNVVVYNSFEKVLEDFKEKELFIAGGASIYKLFMPFVNEFIISHIHGEYEGDVYFPAIDLEVLNKVSYTEEDGFDLGIYNRK